MENLDETIRLEIEEENNNSYILENKWNIWLHHQKDNWKIDGYKKIFTIETIDDFWLFNNNIHLISGLNNNLNNLQIFMMKNNIKPIWEDSENRNGGCWSIKINNIDSCDIWVNLGVYMIGETLLNENINQEINGLSFSQKNNTSSIIKIWVKNSNNVSFDCLNKKIIDTFGYNIIFKSHLAEY
jgi:translation initiation factor 4E